MKVMFVPHNTYHTFNMSFVVPYLIRMGHEYVFVDIDAFHKEKAGPEMVRLGLNRMVYSESVITDFWPDVIVTMNDWAGVVQGMVAQANKMDIPTISMVEGVQDFKDSHVEHIKVGEIRNPYKLSKYVLLTGEYDQQFFDKDKSCIVGVPRIEPLWRAPVAPFPEKPLVTINCNFTYGLYTHIANAWIDDCVQACEELGIDYAITRHHSDKTELGRYNIIEGHIHDVLRKSTLHISRFSTCLLESMALGRPVVYHNPHEERVDTFQNPMGAYLITKNKEELKAAIVKAVTEKDNYRHICATKFEYHVSIDEKSSAERVANAISKVLSNEGFFFVYKKIRNRIKFSIFGDRKWKVN